MKLILFAFWGLIVATAAQDEPNSPKEWHITPHGKPGVCAPPRGEGWQLGPHLLTKSDDKHAVKKRDDQKQEKPQNNLFPFPGPKPNPDPFPFLFPSIWYFQPQRPVIPPYYPLQPPVCTPLCHSDSDCDGTMKCCGSKCNARCTPPLQYDEECGLITTDAYCDDICEKKNKCLLTRDCANYRDYCVSYCRNNNRCYGGKCCRNLKCSFVCIGNRSPF